MSQPNLTDTVELGVMAPRVSQEATLSIENDGSHREQQHQSLEGVDGGRAAWRMLLTAFVFESIIWGFPLSFGVFQNYYSRLPEFADQPYVSVVGTVASGMSYMGAPLIIPVLKRYPKYHRHMIWFGWILCILGILAGSFANTIGALIFTQGIMYGFGFVVSYYPILNMVNEFWIARRGMAYGLLCSASGVSGIAFPFTLETLLERYGYHTTLRIVAVALVVLTGPLLPFLKGRLPASEHSVVPKTDWTFLKVPLFWIYTVSNVMQGLGYFFPSLYLPSYATSIGLSSRQGALLLAVMSVSQVLGQFSYGYLSDRRLSLSTLMLSSTFISAAAVLALWALARNFAMLFVFGLVYGFVGAGYVALWARMGTAVTSEGTAAFATFGLFCFGKGVGNVLAGPIGANLLTSSISVGSYGVGRYEAVVLFSGSCLLASAAAVAVTYLKKLRVVFGW